MKMGCLEIYVLKNWLFFDVFTKDLNLDLDGKRVVLWNRFEIRKSHYPSVRFKNLIIADSLEGVSEDCDFEQLKTINVE